MVERRSPKPLVRVRFLHRPPEKNMKIFGRILVGTVEKVKSLTGLHTYQIEFLFVGIILLSVIMVQHDSWVEYIGAGAVFFSFAHAKVANRLAEREEYRKKKNAHDLVILPYYHKTKKYFFVKEILWFIYFILLGAYSALVGCVIFLLYEPWRKLWRKYHPLDQKLNKYE